jgi:hypothetical protein
MSCDICPLCGETAHLREHHMFCTSSAARRQNAFGCCATHLRLLRYSYFGTCATLPRMREMSVSEQRHKAIRAVIADGQKVTLVARDWARESAPCMLATGLPA